MRLAVVTLLTLLCSLSNAGIFGGDTYTLEEQKSTHFEAALTAYHRDDMAKAIRIFEYLQREIKPSSIKYPFVVWNLALLYHDQEQFSKAIQWAEISSKYETTSFVGGFLLACLLYFKGKTEYYNSFMAFRSIKITKKTLLPDMTIGKEQILSLMLEGIVDYNIALILYKLGAVAAADTHVEDAMNRFRAVTTNLDLFKKVKSIKGIDQSIDTKPIGDFRLLRINGEADVKKTEPLQSNLQSRSKVDASHHTNDAILAYYFESSGPSTSSRHISPKPMFPSPHQLSNHYDHHMDYFSYKPLNPSKAMSPSAPGPKMPRPTLNRGFTAPPSNFGTNIPSSR